LRHQAIRSDAPSLKIARTQHSAKPSTSGAPEGTAIKKNEEADLKEGLA
jgi:hypothetical protein